jgi:hypothetical protein
VGESFSVQGDFRRYEFYIRHAPEPTCKPHSMIYCRDFDSKEDIPKPSKSVREAIRTHLSRRIRKISEATT